MPDDPIDRFDGPNDDRDSNDSADADETAVVEPGILDEFASDDGDEDRTDQTDRDSGAERETETDSDLQATMADLSGGEDVDIDVDPFEEIGGNPGTGDFEEFPDVDAGPGRTDPFEEMAVEELDDDVWEALSGEDPKPDIGGEAHPVDEEAPEDHVVNKRQYCQRCPHFGTPPDAVCTHEGSSVVEVVDIDRFRVRNCPIVSENGPSFDTK